MKHQWEIWEERSVTRPPVYEVMRVSYRSIDMKGLREKDFMRLGNICRFSDLNKAIALKMKLNEKEKNYERT